MVRGHRNTWRILREKIKPEDRPVWFHVASLGEFEQGRPLMERMRRLHPEYKILLTFFSPSGYEVRKNYEGADIVCYLPFDTPSNVFRFFHHVRPEMAFFIKHVCQAACHSRGEVHAHMAQNDHTASRHVFAAMVANSLGYHGHAAVSYSKAFTRNAIDENLAILHHQVVTLIGTDRTLIWSFHLIFEELKFVFHSR